MAGPGFGQVLGFVARRLAADPVALVLAARVQGQELAGLPELVVEGLPGDHARALLDSALTGALDVRVRDQIVAETRGNPLALLELPRALSRSSSRAGSGCPARCRRTPGSRTAPGGSWTACLPAYRQRLDEHRQLS